MQCLCVVLISELVDFVFSVIYDLYDIVLCRCNVVNKQSEINSLSS